MRIRKRRRVVVTGLGLATPLGLDLNKNWSDLLSGRSGISKVSYPDSDRSLVQAAGAINDADWTRIKDEFIEDSRTEGERRALYALWAAKSALKDSGALDSDMDRKRAGVSVASGLGINRLEDIQKWIDAAGRFDYAAFGREYALTHRESIIRNNSNRPAALIARRFGLSGFNCTVTTACASATQSIGIGFKAIQRGDADLVVAGGADSMINPVGLVFFVLLGAAAVSPEDPASLCRPFDKKRSGLVMGEGAGFVVLEEESHARKRSAAIYAEVAGYGSSIDAYQVTAPHPEGTGAAEAIKRAITDAGMMPSDIDYINAHGTSTKLNDAAETTAIRNVFGGHAPRLAISSCKSMIGHLIAASGGPEFVFTVMSVKNDMVHPTINLMNPDPKCDLDYVPNVMRRMSVRAGLSNSFGFGGQNASIIAKKYI